MKRGIRQFPRLWRASRLARRWYYARARRLSGLAVVRRAEAELWSRHVPARQGGPRVLMATSIGSYAHAVDARKRAGGGVDVPRRRSARTAVRRRHDGVRRMRGVAVSGTQSLCRARSFAGSVPRLSLAGRARVSELGITVHRFSDWLRPDDRAEAQRIANAIPASEIPAFVARRSRDRRARACRRAAVLCHRLAR